MKPKQLRVSAACLLPLALAFTVHPALATGLPSDPPKCPICPDPAKAPINSSLNLSEGAIEDDYPVLTLGGSDRVTLALSLTYSSAKANLEYSAAINTPLGFGWSHSYGSFLFQQQGLMFLRDGTGRYSKYTPSRARQTECSFPRKVILRL